MKKLIALTVVLGACLIIYFLWQATMPEVRAHVQIGSEFIVITNGNDKAWVEPAIYLNDTFNGFVLKVQGNWNPGERKKLRLHDFSGIINKQIFDPKFEKVKEVIVNVSGFQMGIYK